MKTSLEAIIIYVCSSISLILNGLLLILIPRKSVTINGPYKWLLLMYVIISFGFSLTFFVTVPTNNLTDGWVMVATSTKFPPDINYYFLVLFMQLLTSLVVNLSYSFVYRYFAICRVEQLKWFKHPMKICILIVISIVVTSFFTGSAYFLTIPTPEKTERYNKLFYPVDISKYGYFAMIFYDEHDKLNTFALGLVIAAMPLFAVVGTTITYTIRSIYKELNSIGKRSKKSEKQQRRLFTLLILQTLDPVLFLVVPCLIIAAMGLLKYSNPFANSVVTLVMPFSQLVEPLLVFIFIGEYRKSVLRMFQLKRSFLKTSSVQQTAISIIPTNGRSVL